MTFKLLRHPTTGEIREDMVEMVGVAFVPNDPRNRDWQAYQAWLAEGNEPEEADQLPEE